MSRSPVREALYILAGKGLVVSLPRRGWKVAELDEASIRDLYAIRGALEGLAARLATERATTRDLDGLRRLVQQMRGAVAGRRRDDYFDANQAFHSAVASLAGNPRLTQLLSDWPVQIYRLYFSDSYLDPTRVGLYIGSHDAVIDAMERGDADAAERLMRRHAEDSLTAALRLLGARSGSTTTPPAPDARQEAGMRG